MVDIQVKHTSDILALPVAQELIGWIEKYQIDDKSSTPSNILALYLLDQIYSLSNAVEARDAYFNEIEVQIPSMLQEVIDEVLRNPEASSE